MFDPVVLLLGSNVEKEKNFPEAVKALMARCLVAAVSSVYETAPVGPDEQPLFWNAAALLATELEPRELKAQVLSPIEFSLGRVRSDDRFAPRTMDLDIVLYGDLVVEEEDLRIPDPDLLSYPHVAVPTAELVPDLCHPITAERIIEISWRLTQETAPSANYQASSLLIDLLDQG